MFRKALAIYERIGMAPPIVQTRENLARVERVAQEKSAATKGAAKKASKKTQKKSAKRAKKKVAKKAVKKSGKAKKRRR